MRKRRPTFFVPLLEEHGSLIDLISKRYGKYPHEVIDLPIDKMGFDLAVALSGLYAEKKAMDKTKTGLGEGEHIPTPDEVLGAMAAQKSGDGWNSR